jgi:ferredoxin
MSTGADIAFFRFIALSVVKRKRIMDIKDIEKYPAMTTYCIYRAWGEVYDFDFEMEHRSHKLLRTGFCYGGKYIPFRGVRITEECIACGECREKCSFKAIYQRDEMFIIDPTKCDVCGDCYTICPSGAIEIVIDGP